MHGLSLQLYQQSCLLSRFEDFILVGVRHGATGCGGLEMMEVLEVLWQAEASTSHALDGVVIVMKQRVAVEQKSEALEQSAMTMRDFYKCLVVSAIVKHSDTKAVAQPPG